ncbi:MAG: 23S rRNA (guanosine(2251)-2'-O)-methyltransferase RlmB [Acidobacteriota bacterium]|nr:MAG: 23S rRNA (guanosine(2251)-2'-O)-methyltransferase RlmB [Acidobacteriota bacterium]
MPRDRKTGHDEKPSGVLFGVMPVLEALRSGSGRLEKVLIAEGKPHQRIREIKALAREQGVPCRSVPRSVIEREAGREANHQGVLAYAASAGYADADALIAELAEKSDPLCIVLDGIEDPHNLGAIIRSAECAGVDAVFVPERRAAGLTDTVAKASAGAVGLVNVARVTNVNRLIEDLKEAGFWIAGAAGESSVIHSDHDWKGKWAIVLGSEGSGIHKLTREKCDVLVKIPLYGRIESLNVSVAAGVLLFEAMRQRSAAGQRPEEDT